MQETSFSQEPTDFHPPSSLLFKKNSISSSKTRCCSDCRQLCSKRNTGSPLGDCFSLSAGPGRCTVPPGGQVWFSSLLSPREPLELALNDIKRQFNTTSKICMYSPALFMHMEFTPSDHYLRTRKFHTSPGSLRCVVTEVVPHHYP